MATRDLEHKVEYELAGKGYGHDSYRIISNPNNVSDRKLAEICAGSVPFGFRREGDLIKVHTD